MPIAPYYPPSEARGREQQQRLPDAVTLRAPSPFHLEPWLPVPRFPCLAARAPVTAALPR